MAMTAAGKEPLSGVTLTGFYDDQDISAWAKGYVSAARAGLSTTWKVTRSPSGSTAAKRLEMATPL